MIRACNLYTNSLSRNKILSRMYNDIKEYPTVSILRFSHIGL